MTAPLVRHHDHHQAIRPDAVVSGRVRDLDVLRVAWVVTLGLDTTTGQSPLIVQAAAYRVAGGLITDGPFSYYAAVDAPYHQIPQRCWPSLYHAPSWPKTAGRLVELIANRVLVMHDRDRFSLLRRHLPDWRPVAVLFTRDLAEQTWPGLADYSLLALTGSGLPSPGHSAVVEAHQVALLLGTLLARPTRPAPR